MLKKLCGIRSRHFGMAKNMGDKGSNVSRKERSLYGS